jgi:hypothetical protein
MIPSTQSAFHPFVTPSATAAPKEREPSVFERFMPDTLLQWWHSRQVTVAPTQEDRIGDIFREACGPFSNQDTGPRAFGGCGT